MNKTFVQAMSTKCKRLLSPLFNIIIWIDVFSVILCNDFDIEITMFEFLSERNIKRRQK